MSAAHTIETLLSLGMTLKNAYNEASKAGVTSWSGFMDSAQLGDVRATVEGFLGRLGHSEVRAALDAVERKKQSLLGGKPVSALPPERLLPYFDLLETEGLLVRRELADAAASEAFFAWLVDEALPKLVGVAKVVVPLLL